MRKRIPVIQTILPPMLTGAVHPDTWFRIACHMYFNYEYRVFIFTCLRNEIY